MKYSLKKFNSAVARYRKALGRGVKGKLFFLVLDISQKDAFFSIAPLSRAIDGLGAELSVSIKDGKAPGLEVLNDIWGTYEALRLGIRSAETRALREFISAVNRKAKNKKFESLFVPPDYFIEAAKSGFSGDFQLGFEAAWFRKYRWKDLLRTCRKILKESYALKKSEKIGVGFDLVRRRKKQGLPLEDYLDSYAIAYALITAAKGMCRKVTAGASTVRDSKLEPMLRCDDLAATLIGCEHEKKINEPVFRKFAGISKLLRINRLKPKAASFGIVGEGYAGKHFFGTVVGYPTPNRKARWLSPGQMFMKAEWAEQTAKDSRKPQTRYEITETLPIDNFIRTCDIDYRKMRKRNAEIAGVIAKCERLFVRGKKVAGGRTEFELNLRKENGKKIRAMGSDSDVRSRIDRKALRERKVLAGMYDNMPGGEAFLTPHDITGTFVGDVVINVDRSYVIPNSRPLVVELKKGHYRIRGGDRKIVKVMERERKDAWKLIKVYEKNKALPKSQIASYKKNFDRIGEFAINTNPKARLSRYLIETEKLARMIHIALGSGFEPGRNTTYHWDIVVNSPRQKIDIYGIDSKGREKWIIRKGKFAI